MRWRLSLRKPQSQTNAPRVVMALEMSYTNEHPGTCRSRSKPYKVDANQYDARRSVMGCGSAIKATGDRLIR